MRHCAKSRSSASDGGFTLIEMLVVVFVISVLFSLLLPAVNTVRESSRQAGCRNNLAQIGIALLNYHDAHGVFPAAYQTKIGGDAFMGTPDPATRDTGPGWGFLMQILPQTDQPILYASLNVDWPCWAPPNTTAARTSVSTYLCPSDTNPIATFDVTGRGGRIRATLAAAHYVANAGRIDAWSAGVDDLTKIPGIDGPFFRNSRVGISGILDGTSNTVFVGERTSGLADGTWVGVVPGALVCSKMAPVGGIAAVSCRGAGALVGVHSGPSPYESPSEIHPPNSGAHHPDQMSSHHPGQAFLLFGDGSVRSLRTAVTPATWAALCTRNGGEMVMDPVQ